MARHERAYLRMKGPILGIEARHERAYLRMKGPILGIEARHEHSLSGPPRHNGNGGDKYTAITEMFGIPRTAMGFSIEHEGRAHLYLKRHLVEVEQSLEKMSLADLAISQLDELRRQYLKDTLVLLEGEVEPPRPDDDIHESDVDLYDEVMEMERAGHEYYEENKQWIDEEYQGKVIAIDPEEGEVSGVGNTKLEALVSAMERDDKKIYIMMCIGVEEEDFIY